MDDEELTKKAIEELMRDAKEGPKNDSQVPKQNPLGRPNKRFLGRTINSMLTHNERENQRTKYECRRKLKQLERKQMKREKRHGKERLRKISLRRCCSESSHEVLSSSTSDESTTSHCRRKKKRRRSYQSRSLSIDQHRPEKHNNIIKEANVCPDNEKVTQSTYRIDATAAAVSTIAQIMQVQAMVNTMNYFNSAEKTHATCDAKNLHGESNVSSSDLSLSSIEDCEENVPTIVVSSQSSDESVLEEELNFDTNGSSPVMDLGVISLSSNLDDSDEDGNITSPIATDVLLVTSSSSSSENEHDFESTNLIGDPPDHNTNSNCIDLTDS